MNFLSSVIIAFSFFTSIPMPFLKWTEKRMKYMPVSMIFVGAAIGGLGLALYKVLAWAGTGSLLNAVVLCLFYLIITGGIHMDGLMDSADAYFSRRETKRKLEIMKDSRVGAFGVMAIVFVILFKTAVLWELLESGKMTWLVIFFIPVISRIIQPVMLVFFPLAADNGLAKMYKQSLKKAYGIILVSIYILVSVLMAVLGGVWLLIIPAVAVLCMVQFYFSAKKQFGGITGDLLGAYLEAAELIMFAMVLFL